MSEKKRAKKIPLEDAIESLIIVKEFFEDWHTELIDTFGESEPEPTPRPLSKGDWVKWDGRLVYLVEYKKDESVIGYDHNGQICYPHFNATRIDTLTEEHLRLIETKEIRYRIYTCGNGWCVYEDYYEDGRNKFCLQKTPFYNTKHEAISECLKSVISRRRLDREMGV